MPASSGYIGKFGSLLAGFLTSSSMIFNDFAQGRGWADPPGAGNPGQPIS